MPPPNALRTSDLVAVLAVVFIWGINFVVMKLGLAYFTAFQMGAGRFLFAFLPLALWVRLPAVRVRWLLAFGLAQGVGQFGFLFVALQVGMTTALASVLMQTQVFFTALLGMALLRERIGRPLQFGLGFAGAGLGMLGMSVLLTGQAAGVTGWSLLLNLAAAAMWAMANIVVRKAQQESSGFDPVGFVVWSSAFAVPPFIALSLVFDAPQAHANWVAAPWQGWVQIAFLGWIATVLANGLWTRLLKRYPANRVAPFSLGIPLVGLSAGIVLLGERVTALQWGGAFLLVCALLCVLLGPRLMQRGAGP
jgi:O-acetylserine/cysteine efflux transporter